HPCTRASPSPQPPRPSHSFPTRRSSDLVRVVPAPPGGAARQHVVRRPPAAALKGCGRAEPGRPTASDAEPALRNRRDLPGGSVKDRKSTRLNSSHSQISYAVFCLKKKR